MTLSNILSCDRVMNGAFFFQPDPKMPQKKMSKHACQYMMIPSRIFSHLVVIKPQLRLCLSETLFDCPLYPAEPNERRKPRAHRRVADMIPILLFIGCSFHHKPHRPVRKPGFAQNHLSFGEFIVDRSFASFRDCPSVPKNIMDSSG